MVISNIQLAPFFMLFLFISFHFILVTQIQRYPFDWSNLIGYFIAVILQCVVAFYLLHYLASFLSLGLGSYLLTASISEFMKDDLRSINKLAKHKKSKLDIFGPFSKFIRSHIEMKQLSYYCICGLVRFYGMTHAFKICFTF